MGLLGSTTQASYYTGSNFGTYQFVNLDTIINNFMYIYVGENKIINKVNRTDVQFHAMRALQELSYDVLRSFKSQEIEVPNTLKMALPQDYVNYIKLSALGSDGIERVLYPTSKTCNPFAIAQATDGTYSLSTARRTVRVTVAGANNISDGDHIALLYKTTGFDGSTTSEITRNVYFVFDKSNSTAGGPPITLSPTQYQAVFHIPVLYVDPNTPNQNSVADLLVNEINSFGHHKATNLGSGVVEIEYTDGTTLTSTTVNTASTEGVYANNVSLGGANGTNMSISITQNGMTSSESLLEQTPSNTLSNYSDTTQSDPDSDDSTDIEIDYRGRRYGLDPQYAQSNGTFYIDNLRGYIHFGSSLAGDTIILKYVSDGVGTDDEMVIHKFCEEACYKWIMYGVLSGRSNIPEYLVQRFKKEKFAETRKAKIRLSNIKIEEFTQVLKGMGKQIK